MTAQQLKNSILQMAVSGKLVPQDPNDEPASVLLERIKAEKEELIKAGKIKKDKKSSEIFRGASRNIPYTFCEQIGGEIRDISDEVPFEIPESWEWVRLKNVVYNRGQMKPMSDFCYIDIGSIDNKRQRLGNDENIIRPDKAPSRARKIVDYDDIIFSTVRPYLHNMCIIDKHFSLQPIASTGFATMTCFSDVFNKFLFFYLLSPHFDNYANDSENSKGVAYPAINDDRLYNAFIPIPPINEQHCIVAKIEQFLPYIEKYEQAETQLTNLNSTFPELLKKTILQEAVQGKLVPQDPNDEPASVLLERIRKEKQELIKAGKIKKDKHESVIVTLDKIPYILPDDWIWVRLGFISTYDEKKQKINAQNADLTQWLLDLEDIERGGRLLVKKTVAERKAVGDKTIFNKGDILYSKLRPYLLKILVASDDGICTPEIVPFTMYGKILAEYVVYYLKSPYVDSAVNDETYGIKMPRAGTETMINLPFPLPPIEEQHRIVKKIEELMPIINTLSK